MAKVSERLDKHDKQIKAIRELVEQGMRLVIDSRREMREFRKDLRALTASQKRTDAALQALINSLRRSGANGHSKTEVDLQ